jgi:heme/copper-type cytochrome/quinol oxidase subunit 2
MNLTDERTRAYLYRVLLAALPILTFYGVLTDEAAPLVAGLITVAVVAVTAIVLAAAGITPQRAWDSFFPPAPVTREGVAIKELYYVVFYIAAAIFFIVEALIIWTVIRYRRKPGDDTLPPQTHGKYPLLNQQG